MKRPTKRERRYLKSQQRIADFVEAIYNDPELNRKARALVKRVRRKARKRKGRLRQDRGS